MTAQIGRSDEDDSECSAARDHALFPLLADCAGDTTLVDFSIFWVNPV